MMLASITGCGETTSNSESESVDSSTSEDTVNRPEFDYKLEANEKYQKASIKKETLSKLSCIIENSEARAILNANILKLSTDMLDYISKVEKQYNQIRSSRAYRLGKFLLKPISLLRSIIKR